MKARIWKDREDGDWRFAVYGRRGPGQPAWTGRQPTWDAVLSELLPELYPPHRVRM